MFVLINHQRSPDAHPRARNCAQFFGEIQTINFLPQILKSSSKTVIKMSGSGSSSAPWTTSTFRHKKFRGHREYGSLSMKQKRTEFKSVQKLSDFEAQRENNGEPCSKLPTPRQYFAPKRRCNLSKTFSELSCAKSLISRFNGSLVNTDNFVDMSVDETEEDKHIWESKGL